MFIDHDPNRFQKDIPTWNIFKNICWHSQAGKNLFSWVLLTLSYPVSWKGSRGNWTVSLWFIHWFLPTKSVCDSCCRFCLDPFCESRSEVCASPASFAVVRDPRDYTRKGREKSRLLFTNCDWMETSLNCSVWREVKCKGTTRKRGQPLHASLLKEHAFVETKKVPLVDTTTDSVVFASKREME